MPCPVLPRLDRFAIPNLVFCYLISSFARFAITLVQVVPSPEVKWVGLRNFENTTGNHREGGDFESIR